MSQASVPKVSVVVPLYYRNPQHPGVPEQLERGLTQFLTQSYSHVEIFLSDSGPPENQGIVEDIVQAILTQHPALQEKVHYVYIPGEHGPLSRGAAMNLGTQQTTGEIVLFLHIDCLLPPHALQSMVSSWKDGVLGGGFLKEYTGKSLWSPLQATERYLNWFRTVLTRQLVGTNAIFLDRHLAEEHPYQGNFLEDVELSDWMRQRMSSKEFRVIRDSVKVSASKYTKNGEVHSIAVNVAVMLLYRVFSTSPDLLKRELYYATFPKGMKFWPSLFQAAWSLRKGRSSDAS